MPELISKSAAERFLKDRVRAEARIGPGVIDALITRLTDIGDQAARKADILAKLAGRNTVLDRDLAEAFDTVAPAGGQQTDPSLVFASLDRMTTEQLSELVRKLQACPDSLRVTLRRVVSSGTSTSRSQYERCRTLSKKGDRGSERSSRRRTKDTVRQPPHAPFAWPDRRPPSGSP